MSLLENFDLRSVLSLAPVYSLLGRLITPDNWRQDFVTTIVKVKEGDRVLDIGCGPADILAVMPDVDYFGFDMSAEYIENAQHRFGSRGTFLHQQITHDVVDGMQPFNIAMALGILHHLNDDEVLILLRTAKKALLSGGRLITFDGAYTDKQSKIAKFLLDLDRGEYIRTPEAYEALAKKVFANVRVELRTDVLRVPYTHCIMECS